VSEELDSAPTTGTNAGYTNAAPAFAQTPPSEWAQTYPDNTSTGTDITGVNTPPEAIANGYGPYSWEVNSLNNPTVAGINFGNHVPAPVCAVFPFDTTICDEDQVTLTAQRIAQGTPPYSYAWSGPNSFTANTQSIVVLASAAGTYTVMLTDANGLVSSGCSGTVSVFPVPDFEITGDTIVCELSTGNAYMPQFDVNSPVPKDSIVAWQWSISGNESVTVSQTIYELCNEFRSLTQGFYGNANGSYCGSLSLSTTGLIDSLLTAHGPLVVGDPLANGSLTIDLGKGACVVQYLPGGGTAIALAKHFAFNPNNCNIHPGGMPLKNGRFNNILLSQTITLALNLRLDTLLAQSFYLPPPKMARPDFRPDGFALHQNHPNPFNPVTTITYSLPEPSTVYLSVYNALGEEISVLVDADASAGTHSVIWNSQNARGTGSSGLFYYRIYAKGESGAVFHDQRKMMLVK
jgi:hypothetical protein